MPKNGKTPKIPLPRSWNQKVRSAVLHVLSLAQYTAVYTRSWAADSVNQRVRLKADLDRAGQENALLGEEMRIKDVRLARIDPVSFLKTPSGGFARRPDTHRVE